MNNPRFKEIAQARSKNDSIGLYEAMFMVTFDAVRSLGLEPTDQNITLGAESRSYNPGVEEFLHHLQEQGVKNYILSSGSKTYLERTVVAPYFDSIYASTFTYDDAGSAVGTEFVMTIPNKAKVLEKIAQVVNGDKDDCSGIVYIGDGFSDLHAMEFIREHGGRNILVYLDINSKDVARMREAGVVDYFAPADFGRGGELWNITMTLGNN